MRRRTMDGDLMSGATPEMSQHCGSTYAANTKVHSTAWWNTPATYPDGERIGQEAITRREYYERLVRTAT